MVIEKVKFSNDTNLRFWLIRHDMSENLFGKCLKKNYVQIYQKSQPSIGNTISHNLYNFSKYSRRYDT